MLPTVLAAAVVVLVIAQDLDDPLTIAFARAARGVLGEGASVQLLAVASDPPDEESVARAAEAAGVVELSWSSDGTHASIHSYVSSEQRWIDREITFSRGTGNGEREASEKGRLLGFAAATMFTSELPAPSEPPAPTPPPPTKLVAPPAPVPKDVPRAEPPTPPGRSLEFAGIASSGLKGTAGGLGAMAGLRLRFTGPLWARAFLAGRSGNLPRAQASTRTALLGGGAAVAAPVSSHFELGLRVDAFAYYFEASHLSEDDVVPDVRSRWLPGADLVAEGGFRFAGNAGLFAGVGLEAILGKTDVYTHGERVAVVPPLRAIGEIGFRTGF